MNLLQIDFASFRFLVAERVTAAPCLCLVGDGKLLRKSLRRAFITDDELFAKIRQEGVEAVAMVKLMYLEADGEMGLIRHDGAKAGA